MAEKLTLEWSYTPPGFFEEELCKFSKNDYVVEIGNGRIIATPSGAACDQIESLSREIQEELNALFHGAQLVSNQRFELSCCTAKRAHPDGTTDVNILVTGQELRMSVGPVDVGLLDAAGNVTADPGKERIEERTALALLVSKHKKDPVVDLLLKSYSAAMCDPQNEFTHLYEILDALITKFRKEARIWSDTSITKDQCDRFEHLANGLPVFQGRHRGAKLGQLRDATPTELDEARTIAKTLIRAYLDYLDGLASTGLTDT